jgi:hypothetical protein
MDLTRGFILLFLIFGIVLIVIYLNINSHVSKIQEKIVYKYIPQTLIEEDESPVYVSEIFKTMFSQPSTWIDSIDADAIRRQEGLNNYFISQI